MGGTGGVGGSGGFVGGAGGLGGTGGTGGSSGMGGAGGTSGTSGSAGSAGAGGSGGACTPVTQSTPWQSPSTASSTTPGTSPWTDPLSVLGSDDNYASVEITGVSPSHFLVVKGFGFSLPADATIVGIEVQVERVGGPGSVGIEDETVRLIRSNNHVGQNMAVTGLYGLIPKTVLYGGPAETWGVAWTVSNVESSSFGVAFQVGCGAALCVSTLARVDHINVRVTYESC